MLKRIIAVMLLTLVVLSVMPVVTPVVPVVAHVDEAQAYFTGMDLWVYCWLEWLQNTVPDWDWDDWC